MTDLFVLPFCARIYESFILISSVAGEYKCLFLINNNVNDI